MAGNFSAFLLLIKRLFNRKVTKVFEHLSCFKVTTILLKSTLKFTENLRFPPISQSKDYTFPSPGGVSKIL